MSWTVKLPNKLLLKVRDAVGPGESPEQFVARVLEKEMRNLRLQSSLIFKPVREKVTDWGKAESEGVPEEEYEEFSVN